MYRNQYPKPTDSNKNIKINARRSLVEFLKFPIGFVKIDVSLCKKENSEGIKLIINLCNFKMQFEIYMYPIKTSLQEVYTSHYHVKTGTGKWVRRRRLFAVVGESESKSEV